MHPTTFAILGTGPSMSQALADFARGRCRVIAVSDAYRIAPWAEALVSNDPAWWEAHPEAQAFGGLKFCGGEYPGCRRIERTAHFTTGLNSGLQAMRVAEWLGGTRLLLLGFDMHARNGAHFFGDHPTPLAQTSALRFLAHIRQFDRWDSRAQAETLNCTPGSALTRFPLGDIHEILRDT